MNVKSIQKYAAIGAAVACLTLTFACGGGKSGGITTGPDTTPTATTPVASATPTPAPGAPTTPTTVGDGSGYSVVFFTSAGWQVTNLTDIRQGYTAYYTSFDDQKTALGSQYGEANPGKDFSGSFSKSCVQVDISQSGPGGLPLKGGFAYFDINGKEIGSSELTEKVAECRRGTPTPNPCPSPGVGQSSTAPTSCPTPPIDVCPNLEGIQLTVPDGDIIDSDGNCVAKTKLTPPTCDTAPDKPTYTITGTPAEDATGFTGIGTVLPIGGTFTTALPYEITQPLFGSPAVTITETYTKTQAYGADSNLECSYSQSATFTLTVQPAGCVNVPTYRTETIVSQAVYGDFGQCSIDTGKKSRTKTVTTTVTTYTKNSCTNVEVAGTPVVTQAVTTDTANCQCSDYTAPTINFAGGLSVTENGQTYTVNSSVTPAGGTYSPALPVNANEGLAFTFHTTYTKTQGYGPQSLQCSVTATDPLSVGVPAGGCYYNVNQTGHDHPSDETTCKAVTGASWNSTNHLCTVPYPGISNSVFQLNPGQSANGCLSKHSD